MKHERPCLVASGSDWLQEVLRRLLVWVVVLSSGTLMAYAGNLDISQTKVITGTVTEKETGDPLIGVNVSVKVLRGYNYKFEWPVFGRCEFR